MAARPLLLPLRYFLYIPPIFEPTQFAEDNGPLLGTYQGMCPANPCVRLTNLRTMEGQALAKLNPAQRVGHTGESLCWRGREMWPQSGAPRAATQEKVSDNGICQVCA